PPSTLSSKLPSSTTSIRRPGSPTSWRGCRITRLGGSTSSCPGIGSRRACKRPPHSRPQSQAKSCCQRPSPRPSPDAYFLYSPDGFDVTGRIRDGVGVTCATFVINIFDRLSLRIVDIETWKARTTQDDAFRQRIIRMATEAHQNQLAERLKAENPSFRLK